MFQKCVVCVFVVLALGACSKSMSPEQKAQVAALNQEIDATNETLAAAKATDAKYSGGAVKAFTTLRIEILETNKALLQQRISAIESGAPITVKVYATKANPTRAKLLATEVETQEKKAKESQSKADAAGGGLVGAMAQVASATDQNTLALLRQQYLIAKYGLAPLNVTPHPAETSTNTGSASGVTSTTSSTNDNDKIQFGIIKPTIESKRFAKQDYQDYIWFNVKFDAVGLDKPTRAIKGALVLTDLFGEPKFVLGWTIDKPMSPGSTYTEKGSGFEYNQFNDAQQWVLATDLKDMKAKFRVDSILYADGTRRDF